MTPVDRQTLARKLGYLEKNLLLLEEYRMITAEELEKVSEKRLAVERLLQTAIESVTDCARLLVAIEDWRKLRDERDALEILAERKVLDADLTQRLLRAKGFRNILVHEYIEIDLTLMCKNLRDSLAELHVFAQSMARWLKEHP